MAESDIKEEGGGRGGGVLQQHETFVSGDGFGSPATHRAPNNVAITWRDLMFCVGARPDDFLTVGARGSDLSSRHVAAACVQCDVSFFRLCGLVPSLLLPLQSVPPTQQ